MIIGCYNFDLQSPGVDHDTIVLSFSKSKWRLIFVSVVYTLTNINYDNL